MQAAKFAQSISSLVPYSSLSETIVFDFDSTVVKAVNLAVGDLTSKSAIFGAFSPIPLLIREPSNLKESISTVACYKSNKLSDDDIEFQAWSSVFVNLKTSVASTSHLYQLWELLNELVPENVLLKYFGCKKMTQEYFAKLTGQSLSTLKHGNISQIGKEQENLDKQAKHNFDGFNFM